MAEIETLRNVSVSQVRYGDYVHSGAHEFYAYSDAEMDQWGDWNVRDAYRYLAFPSSTLVTIEREVVEEADYC